MPSLVDIAPIRDKVTIGGVELEVRGVGIDAIAHVLAESPDLRKMFEAGAVGGGRIDPIAILRQAPAAAHEIIAAAMGKLGDKKEVEAAKGLPFGDQVTLIESIVKLSFPGGVNPFVARLTALLGRSEPLPNGAALPSGKEPDTSSLPLSTS